MAPVLDPPAPDNPRWFRITGPIAAWNAARRRLRIRTATPDWLASDVSRSDLGQRVTMSAIGQTDEPTDRWDRKGLSRVRSTLRISELARVCLPSNPSRYSEDRLPVVRQGSWALAPRDTPCGATDARRRKTEEPRGLADRRLPRGGTARRSEGSYAAWRVYR
jgi:hypothetical protein